MRIGSPPVRSGGNGPCGRKVPPPPGAVRAGAHLLLIVARHLVVRKALPVPVRAEERVRGVAPGDEHCGACVRQRSGAAGKSRMAASRKEPRTMKATARSRSWRSEWIPKANRTCAPFTPFSASVRLAGAGQGRIRRFPTDCPEVWSL